MALNIKNAEVERLASDVARMAGESKTEAVRKSLEDRKQVLQAEGKGDQIDELMRWLREEVWPTIPADLRGKPIPKEFYDDLYE